MPNEEEYGQEAQQQYMMEEQMRQEQAMQE
jgi:hypothetical protein